MKGNLLEVHLCRVSSGIGESFEKSVDVERSKNRAEVVGKTVSAKIKGVASKTTKQEKEKASRPTRTRSSSRDLARK